MYFDRKLVQITDFLGKYLNICYLSGYKYTYAYLILFNFVLKIALSLLSGEIAG